MDQRMSALVALKELGHDTRKPCKGHVIVETGRSNKPFKTYAFRHQAGSGRVKCRLGRLVGAYRQGGSGLIIFTLDR